MLTDWTRGEILQLVGIVAATSATLAGVIVAYMVRSVHIMVNNRLTQMLIGAKAEGQLAEQGERRERERVRELKPT